MSVGLNMSIYYSNPNRFKNIIRSEKILRRIDDVYLIDSLGNIYFQMLEILQKNLVFLQMKTTIKFRRKTSFYYK